MPELPVGYGTVPFFGNFLFSSTFHSYVSFIKNKNWILIKKRSGIQVFLLFFLIFFILVTQGWPAEQVERGSHRLGDEAHQIASHGITRVNQLQFISVLRIRIRDPGLGAFWPLDPGSGISFFRIPDLGSRISDPGSQDYIFKSFLAIFLVKSSIILWK